MEELQPRMFSFNSPFGACETCDGLGVEMRIDEGLIIPTPSLSISEGAIAIYRNVVDGWRGQYLEAVAQHAGFDVNTPICELSKQQYNILMYGTEDKIKFNFVMKGGDAQWSHHGGWEGLLPQTERLYKQTESDYRRREIEKFMRVSPCPTCQGKRLKQKILAVKVENHNISDLTDMSILEAKEFFKELDLTERQLTIARSILREIDSRLSFLVKVGLGYLTLSRSAGSLSGGEAQRIRLATQIGTNLTGVLYILDEPSIGLHQRDNQKLIETLEDLRDLGNTLLVVEHDEDTILAADHVVDLGPGAGVEGGVIVAEGPPESIASFPDSLTGDYLSRRKTIDIPRQRRLPKGFMHLTGCAANNLKNIDVRFPLGGLTLITGVSGSGKSTLVYEILYRALMNKIHHSTVLPGKHQNLSFDQPVDKVVVIDQSPIGRTPRSNPATYTKLFDDIRKVFAEMKEARIRGYKAGRGSFFL
jgi:excinuclease ABC subunit A